MHKKFLIGLLAGVTAVAAAIGFTACEGDNTVHTHVLTHYEEIGASCTQKGTKEHWTCSDCGKSFLSEKAENEVAVEDLGIDLLPHTKTVETKTEATCTADGSGRAYCSTCGLELEESVIIPANHKMSTEHICSVCGVVWHYSEGLEYALNSAKSGYEVTGIGTASGDIVIPYFYEGLPVTGIRERAFYFCSELTGLTVPSSVTDIGEMACYYCSGLAKVAIPSSVMNIGGSAFYYCSSLTDVTISNTITSIAYGTFEGCRSLQNVTIGNRVKCIGERAFYQCGFDSIALPDSVESIGDDAFSKCSLLSSLDMGKGLQTIGSYAFYDCAVLTDVTIPESITKIEVGAFRGCSGLASVTIPNGVTNIKSDAFRGCGELTSIRFEGTKDEWKAIKNEKDWNIDTGDYVVKCTDGKLDKKGNEIE